MNTPAEMENRVWRRLAADLMFTLRLYDFNYGHKQMWECVDRIIDALSGYDMDLHEQTKQQTPVEGMDPHP